MEPTIVLILTALFILALVAPRLRISRLVPVVAILLGFFLAALGVVPTLTEVFGSIIGFFRSLPIDF